MQCDWGILQLGYDVLQSRQDQSSLDRERGVCQRQVWICPRLSAAVRPMPIIGLVDRLGAQPHPRVPVFLPRDAPLAPFILGLVVPKSNAESDARESAMAARSSPAPHFSMLVLMPPAVRSS